MEIRKITLAQAAGTDGAGGGDSASSSELFEFATVSTKMGELIDVKDEIKKLLQELTDDMSDKVKNSDGAILRGDISSFWNSWNDFQTSYEAFSKKIDDLNNKVADASTKTEEFQEAASAVFSRSSSNSGDSSTGNSATIQAYTQ